MRAVTSLTGLVIAADDAETLGLMTWEAMICVATTSGTGLTTESGNEVVIAVVVMEDVEV